MSGQLIGSGEGGGLEHCAVCGALAAGPCASCRKPLCGDCCVLTTHGAGQWAICKACERKRGRSLAGAWLGLGGWLLMLLAALAVLVVLLYVLAR
jgi:hypothetical protein